MPIITTKCYISSCEKKYTIDSLYRDKFIYCSGKCYQQSFDNLGGINISNKVKRPMNAYMLFSKEKRAEIIQQKPELTKVKKKIRDI